MEERKTIYLCLAHMSETGEEQKYVKEAFDTNWVVPLGPNVNGFEDDLKAFVSKNSDGSELSREVVALSAGTAAVHLGLLASGVGPGDEVCVQSFTFCASSHPITYLGATPVFIDSEPDSWNMDPELLEMAIIDRKEKTMRKSHITRLNHGECNPPAGVIFIDILSNMERIGDHAHNFAFIALDIAKLHA